jgi:hypothetical protein
MLKEKDGALKAIIFLSDGNNATCQTIDNPCGDAVHAKELGIQIFAIGINDLGKGSNYLKCMAKTTGGSYYPTKIYQLEKICGDLSKTIPNIIAKDIVLTYRVPDSVDISTTDSSMLVGDKGHNLTYYVGTISSKEQKKLAFEVSSTEKGVFPLGIGPGSAVELIGYDNGKYRLAIPQASISIQAPSPILNDSTSVSDNMTNTSGVQFSLAGQGGNEVVRDRQTDVSIQKLITPNEQGTGPKIVFKITAPRIQELNLVIAADSSGSTVLYPDQGQTDQDIIKI